MQRSRISSSEILRGLAPDLTMKSLMIFSVTGRGLGVAVLVVVVVAGAGLLAAAVHLAEHVADGLALGLLLHPADVEAGQVAHGERAHGEAEVVEHPVDVPGHGAFHASASAPRAGAGPGCGCRRSRGRRRPARRSCRSAWPASSRWRSRPWRCGRRGRSPAASSRWPARRSAGRSRPRGRLVTEAISSMFRPEVLVARIAPGLQIASSLAKMSFLMSIRSNTASMTRSTSLKASSMDERAGDQAHALSRSPRACAVRERS